SRPAAPPILRPRRSPDSARRGPLRLSHSLSLMDKKNTTIGVVLLIAAFAALMFAPKSPPPTKPENAQTATNQAATPAGSTVATAPPASGPPATPGAAGTATTPTTAPAPMNGVFAPLAKEPKDAVVTTLANDTIEARFTEFGGAVREIAFKKYPAVQGK